MKWNRHQYFCHFRKEIIVKYDVKVGQFTLEVSPSFDTPKWHYGVALDYSYLIQNSYCDSAKDAKKAAINAMRKFLVDTINLLPPENNNTKGITRYTVYRTKSLKDDTSNSPNHGSEDGDQTLCGKAIDELMFINNNDYTGTVECRKCLAAYNKSKQMRIA